MEKYGVLATDDKGVRFWVCWSADGQPTLFNTFEAADTQAAIFRSSSSNRYEAGRFLGWGVQIGEPKWDAPESVRKMNVGRWIETAAGRPELFETLVEAQRQAERYRINHTDQWEWHARPYIEPVAKPAEETLWGIWIIDEDLEIGRWAWQNGVEWKGSYAEAKAFREELGQKFGLEWYSIKPWPKAEERPKPYVPPSLTTLSPEDERAKQLRAEVEGGAFEDPSEPDSGWEDCRFDITYQDLTELLFFTDPLIQALLAEVADGPLSTEELRRRALFKGRVDSLAASWPLSLEGEAYARALTRAKAIFDLSR